MSAAVLHLVLRWRVDRPMPHAFVETPGTPARSLTARGEAHDVAALLITARGTGFEMMTARMWLQNVNILYLKRCLSHVHQQLRVSRADLGSVRAQLHDVHVDIRVAEDDVASTRAQLSAEANLIATLLNDRAGRARTANIA